MTRPLCDKKIGFCPSWKGYKPFGCKTSAKRKAVEISRAETESMRLKNIEDMDQTAAAGAMGVSQSTFQRLLASAYKKVSIALIEGRELKVTEE